MSAPTPSPVTPFRGSATERTLRGALADRENSPDPSLVIVCADDLTRALDQIDAYERGAAMLVVRREIYPAPREPWWVTRTFDALGGLGALAVLAWGFWLWSQR